MTRVPLGNIGSSPPSSTDTTHVGTPSTSMTAVSPEACGSTGRNTRASRFGLRVDTSVAQQSTSQASHLQLPSNVSAQLSPTAEEFTPRTTTFHMNPQTFNFNTSAMNNLGARPMGNLNADSIPDVVAAPTGVGHGAVGQNASPGSANDHMRQRSTPLGMGTARVNWELFSTDQGVTRHFQIFDKFTPSLTHIITNFPAQFKSLSCIDSKHIADGIVRLSFRDDRDAKQAYVLASCLTHAHCQLTQLTAKDLVAAHGKDPSNTSNYEGQLIVSLIGESGPLPSLLNVFNKLVGFGHVRAIHSVAPPVADALSYRVEYHDTAAAEDALAALDKSSYRFIRFVVHRYEPDVGSLSAAPATNPSPPDSNAGQPSLTGRSTIPPDDLARLESVMARIMRECPNLSRICGRSAHNHVDIDRIQAGLDVRTTIMLRNIPNKVDQANLKTLLDQTSFGSYDFMYLRIDFANDCNVGYAFINFVDALSIVPFAAARAGKRWNIFSSDKIAEISYATIQGRDCLVQKFRNSSVMLEHPSYRPKLYITRPSPYAGREEPFPEPDNYSKMRRSIDNAEHIGLYHPAHGTGRQVSPPANVTTRRSAQAFNINSFTPSPTSSTSSGHSGLFAPREGQAHREEQRRRRSQFDRGTPGAEYEAFSYGLTDPALSPSRLSQISNAFASLPL